MDALNYAAKTNRTSHEKLQDVELARIINAQCGGVVIAPWDVNQLDEEWQDVFLGLAKLPELRERYQAFENRLAEIRRKHPSYRKYLS